MLDEAANLIGPETKERSKMAVTARTDRAARVARNANEIKDEAHALSESGIDALGSTAPYRDACRMIAALAGEVEKLAVIAEQLCGTVSVFIGSSEV
jgi:hypothetical protein